VLHAPVEVSAWFAERLDHACSLVFMSEGSRRSINPVYANGITALNDGFPYLILSEASLDDLNVRGGTWAHERMVAWTHVPMDRFRPSIVIAGV
jgi:uncharacterized protein YcbX